MCSSGDALVGAAHRLGLFGESNAAFALSYGVIALVVLLICIYGFHLMLFLAKIMVPAATALLFAGFAALWSHFDLRFAGKGLQPGTPGFWPLFVAALMIALANPISFGAFLGDWSRYLPRNIPAPRLMLATLVAQLIPLFPFFFGLLAASSIAVLRPEYIATGSFAGGLLAIAPQWFLLPLMVLAIVSGLSTGTTSLYGTGLDFRASREHEPHCSSVRCPSR